MPLGSSEAREKAIALAQQAETLPALKDAIADFDGLAVRKTAMNLVFADGDPASRVMIVGEAPGADEDRMGKPFVGASGQLLDRILEAVGLSRNSDDPGNGVYISNILNWRPPGNRTPTKGEIDVSLPFIERHIALAKPDILLMAGGVASKALLNQTASLSKLRGGWHEYKPVTADISSIATIKARAVYHPAYLLRTPGQKKRVWADMLAVRDWLDQNTST
jgi:DNA polymerase